MSYLRLIQYKVQDWAETMASVLNVEVAIADKNLTRIVGTGNFYDKIEENFPNMKKSGNKSLHFFVFFSYFFLCLQGL